MERRSLRMVDFGGRAYKLLLERELQAERDLSVAFQQRGIAVAGIGSGLVALVSSIFVLTLSQKTISLSSWTIGCVVLALLAFVVAGVAGIFANKPMKVDKPDEKSLDEMLKLDHWDEPYRKASRAVADVSVRLIRSWRHTNEVRACWLNAGVWFEVVGMAFAVLAVFSTLVHNWEVSGINTIHGH